MDPKPFLIHYEGETYEFDTIEEAKTMADKINYSGEGGQVEIEAR